MPMRSLDLSEDTDAFIEAGVHAGRFRDAGHAADEGLRLLERREAEDLGESFRVYHLAFSRS